jgi:hypothetical protein
LRINYSVRELVKWGETSAQYSQHGPQVNDYFDLRKSAVTDINLSATQSGLGWTWAGLSVFTFAL